MLSRKLHASPVLCLNAFLSICTRNCLHIPSSLALPLQVDRVERFVVVHGQIILNQFKHFPNKAVQKAAFVSELKHRMEMRRHSKLYMSKVGRELVSGSCDERAAKVSHDGGMGQTTALRCAATASCVHEQGGLGWCLYRWHGGDPQRQGAAWWLKHGDAPPQQAHEQGV